MMRFLAFFLWEVVRHLRVVGAAAALCISGTAYGVKPPTWMPVRFAAEVKLAPLVADVTLSC